MVDGFEESRALQEEVDRLRALVEYTVRWLRGSGHPVKAALLSRDLERGLRNPG